MTRPPHELLDLLTTIVDALEASGLPYALGGAIALGAWSEPRATKDIDLTVFLPSSRWDEAFDVLATCSLPINRDSMRREAEKRGMFVIRSPAGYRVDVFVPSIPFYQHAEKRRQRVHLVGRETFVLDPESLVTFKMLFYRPKDLVDVARLLEVRTLDKGFVRDALTDIVGADDERVRRWGLMTRDHE